MLIHNSGQVQPQFQPIINTTQPLYVFFHSGFAAEDTAALILNNVAAHRFENCIKLFL